MRYTNRSEVGRAALLSCAVLAACACSGTTATPPAQDGPSTPDVAALAVRTLDWNPSRLSLGRVASIVERGDELVVFSDTGAYVLAGGAIVSSETSITGWSAGALIAAGDGSTSSWLVGIDGEGRVFRLRATGAWENVSDRFGLDGERVRAIAAPGMGKTLFVLDRGLAIADGQSVRRYDTGRLSQLSAGGGRVAAILDTGAVLVFDVATEAALQYPIVAAGAVVRANGRLAVTTLDTLYLERSTGALESVFRASPGEPLHVLATAGARTWFMIGTNLGLIEADDTVRRTNAQTFPSSATLAGSPGGDAWLLAAGEATRVGIDDATMAKVRRWEESVRPIFLTVCAKCHLPGGEGRLNLSSYNAWIRYRDDIHERVIVDRSMPPAGTTLAESDRNALRAWLEDPNR